MRSRAAGTTRSTTTTRQRLRPYLGRMIGTAGDGVDDARAWRCADWLVRTGAPALLGLRRPRDDGGGAARPAADPRRGERAGGGRSASSRWPSSRPCAAGRRGRRRATRPARRAGGRRSTACAGRRAWRRASRGSTRRGRRCGRPSATACATASPGRPGARRGTPPGRRRGRRSRGRRRRGWRRRSRSLQLSAFELLDDLLPGELLELGGDEPAVEVDCVHAGDRRLPGVHEPVDSGVDVVVGLARIR